MFFNFSLISFPKHSYSLSFFTPTLYQELAAFLHHRGDFHRQRKSHWSDHWMFRIHAGHTWRFWCFHFGRWRCFWASFEKFFDEIAQANYRWELTEEQGKYFERYLRLTRRQKTQNKYYILTSVPLYIKSAIGFRSFVCCNWSESLIWHKTLSLLLGPMLIDVHLSSIVHQFLQWLYICIPTGNEMFLRTWPTNAYPYVGCRNMRRRQLSVY